MLENAQEYVDLVNEIKQDIAATQQRVVINANRDLIALYFRIGKSINGHKSWGSKFTKNLAFDIRQAFPHIRGFSERNLQYMAQFAKIYSDVEIEQEPPAQLTWTHNIVLMDRVKDRQEMLWYARETVDCGWSSNILAMQIDSNLYARQALADKTTNFMAKLPVPHGDLVEQTLKDPYIFDFVEHREKMVERDVEDALVANITRFLLELGKGFSFVGQQYHLEIGGQDFYIDLLFYHLKLRRYIVIELKTTEFFPEYAGKLNFYISAVDDLLKSDDDNPTIGLLLCREKNKAVAKYALKDIDKPMSVNEYRLLEKLPQEYAAALPTVEDIESRLKLPST